MRKAALSGVAIFMVAAGVVASPASARTIQVPQVPSIDLTPTGSAPVYEVLSEGLSVSKARSLARKAKIGLALRSDGSMSFLDPKAFSLVPAVKPTGLGQGAAKTPPNQLRQARLLAIGKPTDEGYSAQSLKTIDFKALARQRVMPNQKALRLAGKILPTPAGLSMRNIVGHTTAEYFTKTGKPRSTFNLDTTISRQFELDGKPVVGPGAKSRISFDRSGKVLQLTHAVRGLRPAGQIPIISAAQAQRVCRGLYGPGTEQGLPSVVYYAPELSAQAASGQGSVQRILPHYACSPAGMKTADESGPVTGRLVPAAIDAAPRVGLSASGDGKSIQAQVSIGGGAAPYQIKWMSSTTDGIGTSPSAMSSANSSPQSVSYSRVVRGAGADESVSVQVTDANGIVSSAAIRLVGGSGQGSTIGLGGAMGTFAEVGIEQTVDEWQCAQDSANGFKSVMSNKGQSINFDWRGANAWEADFKRHTLPGGDDPDWVDSVDAQWYTGHGWPGGFTFKSSITDTQITPEDASWGDSNDLEWLQLESCQVLRDTTGTLDHLTRWAPAFNGLHLINGFHTNAYCLNGGTGKRFAEYLFPEKFLWWTVRPALTVQQAWAAMASDLEPAGVRWRTMSPVSKSGVSNLGDYYWGQGPVGPDIPKSNQAGFISVSGLA